MPHRWLVGCGLWNFKGSSDSCGDILNRQLDVSPVLKSDFDLGAGGRTELGQLQSTAGNRSGLSNPNPNLNCQTQFESKYGHEICFSETHQLLLSTTTFVHLEHFFICISWSTSHPSWSSWSSSWSPSWSSSWTSSLSAVSSETYKVLMGRVFEPA